MKRETQSDLDNEGTIIKAVCSHLNVTETKLPLNKFKVDRALLNNKTIVGWVECKWYSKPGFYGMNLTKYMEGVNLGRLTGLPFYMAIRIPGKIGLTALYDHLWEAGDPKFCLTGGNNGRKPLDDDIEPMAMFEESIFTWIREK